MQRAMTAWCPALIDMSATQPLHVRLREPLRKRGPEDQEPEDRDRTPALIVFFQIGKSNPGNLNNGVAQTRLKDR